MVDIRVVYCRAGEIVGLSLNTPRIVCGHVTINYPIENFHCIIIFYDCLSLYSCPCLLSALCLRINSNYLFTEPEIKDLLNIFFLYLVLTPNVTKVQVENVTTIYE